MRSAGAPVLPVCLHKESRVLRMERDVRMKNGDVPSVSCICGTLERPSPRRVVAAIAGPTPGVSHAWVSGGIRRGGGYQRGSDRRRLPPLAPNPPARSGFGRASLTVRFRPPIAYSLTWVIAF